MARSSIASCCCTGSIHGWGARWIFQRHFRRMGRPCAAPGRTTICRTGRRAPEPGPPGGGSARPPMKATTATKAARRTESIAMKPSRLPMNRYEIFLALRYLTTRRKQTFITIITTISVLGVAVGVAALIIGLSLATGIHQDIRERILGANAHVTVFASPGSEGMEDYAALEKTIRRVPGVEATAPVLFEKGLMTSELNPGGTAVFLKGVDPAAEARVTEVASRFTAGKLDELGSELSGGDRIALGKDLARTLGVEMGDRVRVIVGQVRMSPWDIRPRSRVFEVAGIIDSGSVSY